jgi:hypothetical protein
LKAPRLIARSICRPRQVGGARTIREDRSGQAKCDLAKHRNPFGHLERTFLSLFKG